MRIKRKDFLKSVGIGTIATLTGGGLKHSMGSHLLTDEVQTKTLPKRKLGKNGLMASVLGLGGGSRFTGENFLPAHAREEYLFTAFDQGVNYIDTASNYGPSERILGELLTDNDWDKLILSTKTNSNTRKGIMEDFKTSRNSLKRDYFDVYLLHDSALAPTLDENVEAFETLLELREQGAVGNIGFSSHGAVSYEVALKLVDRFDLDHLVLSVCPHHYELEYQPIIPDIRELGATAAAIKLARVIEGEWPEVTARDTYKEVLELPFTAGIITHTNEGIGEGGWKKVLNENLETARTFG